jgi:hypothetical protein
MTDYQKVYEMLSALNVPFIVSEDDTSKINAHIIGEDD